jgi:hypothetical protein
MPWNEEAEPNPVPGKGGKNWFVVGKVVPTPESAAVLAAGTQMVFMLAARSTSRVL